MDLFVQKLEEYGLEVRSPGGAPKPLDTIELQLEDIKRIRCPVMKTKELIANLVYIFFADKEKFIKKMEFEEELGNMSLFVLENLDLGYDLEDDRIYYATYDMVDHDEKDVLAYVEENKAYYEANYPEWKLKRLFDEKADDLLVEKLYEEQEKFVVETTLNKNFEKLFQELTGAVAEQCGEVILGK